MFFFLKRLMLKCPNALRNAELLAGVAQKTQSVVEWWVVVVTRWWKHRKFRAFELKVMEVDGWFRWCSGFQLVVIFRWTCRSFSGVYHNRRRHFFKDLKVDSCFKPKLCGTLEVLGQHFVSGWFTNSNCSSKGFSTSNRNPPIFLRVATTSRLINVIIMNISEWYPRK